MKNRSIGMMTCVIYIIVLLYFQILIIVERAIDHSLIIYTTNYLQKVKIINNSFHIPIRDRHGKHVPQIELYKF